MSIRIRASALSDFLDCPARAEAKHLLGMRVKKGVGAALGSAVHASTAAFDGSKLAGNPLTVDESAGAAVDAIRRPDDDIDWSDESPDKVEKIAIGLHTKYCGQIAPMQDYAAVEVRCDHLEISDLGITLTGTTDRVRRTDAGFGIADIKTGKSAVRADGHVETKGHAFQIGVYELLAQAGSGLDITAPGQIVGLNVGVKDATQRVAAGEIHGARDALLGDADHPGILQTIGRVLKEGNFWGNPRSMLCHEKYCPIYNVCHYRR